MKNLLGILYGAVFGIANIIPGVSGGTMLVTFGCYDQVCGALALDIKEIKRNFRFLIFFAIGAAFGIVGFSNVITLLFDNFPTETYMFFIGLIVGSIPLIIRNATIKEKFRPACAIPFLIALGMVIGLAVLEKTADEPAPITYDKAQNGYTVTFLNNSDKDIDDWWIEYDGVFIISAGDGVKLDSKKSAFGELFGKEPERIVRPAENSVLKAGESVTFTAIGEEHVLETLEAKYSYKTTPTLIITIVLASFAAAMAMIIPGVSGSFIMVLLGTYATVISALKSFNFVILIPAAVGILLGLVLGARLIRVLLKKHRLIVFSAILGLCAGSLYAILPEGFGFNVDTAIGAAAMIAGGALSFFIGKNTETEE